MSHYNYVAHQITSALRKDPPLKEDLLHLHRLIRSFNPTKQRTISARRIQEILDYIDELGYMRWINRPRERRQLVVLSIPYRHPKFNSWYGEEVNMIICSPSHKANESSKEEVFLHELGHSFHSHITGRLLDTPVSFKPIISNWFQTEKIPDNDAGQVIKQDIFADCFATAVLAQNEAFHSLSYFIRVFEPPLLRVLIYYFNEISKENGDSKDFWKDERKEVFMKLLDQDN